MQFTTPCNLVSIALLWLNRRPVLQTQCWTAVRPISNRVSEQLKQTKDHHENEEIFYRYTSGRWLFKEDEQLAKRYVRFNIPALKRAASNVVKSPCVSITKLPEGHFNKVFLLKFNNGRELIAKIPNPNAGVPYFSISSEVATLDFLRTVLNIPVPKVYAWNSRLLSNPVDSEYIIMDRVSGHELDQIWPDVSSSDRASLVNSIVQIEAKLANTNFAKYGSLYYVNDIMDQGRSNIANNTISLGLEDEVSRKYAIGRSTERGFWVDERSEMDIDRGPWTSTESYFSAIAKREIAWITYAKRRYQTGSLRSKLHVELLEKFLRILPFIIPKQEDILSPTLWHTDLHRGNIFVDSASRITSIIDWQGVCLAPFFQQARFASAFECDWVYPWGAVMPPPLRADIDELSENDRQYAQREYSEVKLKKYYEVASRKFNPRLFQALDIMQITDNNLISSIFDLVGQSWINGPIPLRHVLIQIALSWENLTRGTNSTCPISFPQNEIDKSGEEAERWANAYNQFHTLRSRLVGKDGWVSHDEYHDAKAQLDSYKERLKELQANLEAAGGTDVDNIF